MFGTSLVVGETAAPTQLPITASGNRRATDRQDEEDVIHRLFTRTLTACRERGEPLVTECVSVCVTPARPVVGEADGANRAVGEPRNLARLRDAVMVSVCPEQ